MSLSTLLYWHSHLLSFSSCGYCNANAQRSCPARGGTVVEHSELLSNKPSRAGDKLQNEWRLPLTALGRAKTKQDDSDSIRSRVLLRRQGALQSHGVQDGGLLIRSECSTFFCISLSGLIQWSYPSSSPKKQAFRLHSNLIWKKKFLNSGRELGTISDFIFCNSRRA